MKRGYQALLAVGLGRRKPPLHRDRSIAQDGVFLE